MRNVPLKPEGIEAVDLCARELGASSSLTGDPVSEGGLRRPTGGNTAMPFPSSKSLELSKVPLPLPFEPVPDKSKSLQAASLVDGETAPSLSLATNPPGKAEVLRPHGGNPAMPEAASEASELGHPLVERRVP